MENPTPISAVGGKKLLKAAYYAGELKGRYTRFAYLIFGSRRGPQVVVPTGGAILDLSGSRDETVGKIKGYAEKTPIHSFLVIDPDDGDDTGAVALYEELSGLPVCWRFKIGTRPKKIDNVPERMIPFFGLAALSVAAAMSSCRNCGLGVTDGRDS